MRTSNLLLAICLSITFHCVGQEKWTCYTDDKLLLMDDYRTLGVFEYTDGTMWMVTDRGINIFNGEQWKKINNKSDKMNKSISSYLLDSKNRIWIGSNKEVYYGPSFLRKYPDGVTIYDGDTWKSIQTKDLGFKAPVITRMFEAKNGDIWLGVSSHASGVERTALFAKGAVLRYANDTWTVYKSRDMPCLSCEFVKSFYEDEGGRVYFFAEHGLYYFEDGSFHRIKKDEGYHLKSWPTAMFLDSKKNLWVGGMARVAMYNGSTWQSFTRKNGLPSSDWPPLGFSETADGKIIMTSRNGLFHYNGAGQWEQEKIKFLTGNSYVDKQNRIWASSHKGLMIQEGDAYSLQKDIAGIWGTLQDNNGGEWALSRRKGVKRFKDGQWQLFDKDNQLPSDRILSGYVADDGKVWIATSKGICSCTYTD